MNSYSSKFQHVRGRPAHGINLGKETVWREVIECIRGSHNGPCPVKRFTIFSRCSAMYDPATRARGERYQIKKTLDEHDRNDAARVWFKTECSEGR